MGTNHGRGAPLSSMRIMLVLFVVTVSLAVIASTAQAAHPNAQKLKRDFYKSRCPSAEKVITTAVNNALNRQPKSAVGILRVFFHDCFVNGCDASVLIDGPNSEKNSTDNGGLHGFEVIDAAKAAVEKQCPGVVSCADVLALATQLSVKKLSGGKITYKVPLGRRDGLRSLASDVTGKLPKQTASVADLKKLFNANGLSTQDLVALSGAHSVGTAGCGEIKDRLTASPATLDPTYRAALNKSCPPGSAAESDACHWEWQCAEMENKRRNNLDVTTPNVLDEVYYKNLQNKKGLLTSDQNLQSDRETRPMVAANTQMRTFGPKFAKAMVKLGNIVHLSGTQGEIRLNCRRFNKK
ncbi:hypothetical protein KC19_8G128900 [Ceratodon purpureus]|uniref:Peroxidase n=1 Tax=Ceratodon purpureus TaxID=3225 RepID=A0A8T0H1J6_CERPU|nr:hypothetical protein KC19_8G128900 [Ceratodon purpureus]